MAGNHSLEDFLDAGDDAEPETASGPSGSPAATQPAEADDGADGEPDAIDAADADADVVDDGGDDKALETAEPGAGTETPDPKAVSETADPAEITYDWSPDGDACDACGESVERRWRAGEGADDPAAMVCGDCKDW